MNTYGNYYMPFYEGQILLYVDRDGTTYTVNRQEAELVYKWTTGKYGIGYYLIEEDN